MAMPEFEYIAFAQAKQKVARAEELKDAGQLEAPLTFSVMRL